MTKTYKLLIESPEYPKGTLAVYKDEYLGKSYYAVGTYIIFYPADHEQKLKRGLVYKEAVENRPHIWELQEDKLGLRSPEAEKMREEARSKRWEFVPSIDENFSAGYFSWDFIQNNTIKLRWKKDVVDICNWNMGCVKRTDEEALAWGEKYARYFLTE